MSTKANVSAPQNLQPKHNIVSQEEWIAARKELLKKEKEAVRLGDQLSAERRQLPWVKIDKDYLFDTPAGKMGLGDLFAGRSQLAIYHFMFDRIGRRAAQAARSFRTISTARFPT